MNDKRIICKKCGWSWQKSEAGSDMYFCHKCNTDNTPNNINEVRNFIKESVRTRLMENRIKIDMVIPKDIMGIKDIFKKNGHKLYIVGGAVRDTLLGKQPKDYDKILQ